MYIRNAALRHVKDEREAPAFSQRFTKITEEWGPQYEA